MKKIFLIVSLLIFAPSIMGMEDDPRDTMLTDILNFNPHGPEVKVQSSDKGTPCYFIQSGSSKREIGLQVALSIPRINSQIMEGHRIFNYEDADAKGLENFCKYAFHRYALQPSTQGVLGEVIGDAKQIKKEREEFLDKLPVQELSLLTIMTVEMYNEPLPHDLYDFWQSHITSEIKQGRGKGQFLENFKDKETIGEYIYGFCFGAGGHEEKIGIERKTSSITSDNSDRKKEETIDANDDELGWRKFFSQKIFAFRQKCFENRIAIGGLLVVGMAYFYITRK